MKRFILGVIIVFFMVGVGYCDWTVRRVSGNQYTLTQTFTASGTTFSASNFTVTSVYEGFWVSHVKLVPGATGPTDDCDIDILVGSNDILGGNGTDIMDESVSGYCTAYGSGGDAQYPLTLGEVLAVTPDAASENAVSSASTTVTIVLER